MSGRVYEVTQELIDNGYPVSNAIKEWNKRILIPNLEPIILILVEKFFYPLIPLLDCIGNGISVVNNKDEDNGFKVRDENSSTFSNIVIYFLIKRKVGLTCGQKLVGRYMEFNIHIQILDYLSIVPCVLDFLSLLITEDINVYYRATVVIVYPSNLV